MLKKSSPKRKTGFRNTQALAAVEPILNKKLENSGETREIAPEVAQKVIGKIPENIVHGVFSVGYDFNYKSGSPYHNGKIIFHNGDTKDVSFIEAKDRTFNVIHSPNICDERLIPQFVVYCEKISTHIICYDRFQCSLEDWLTMWFKSNSIRLKNAYGLPHFTIKTQISKLLKAVDNIHKRGLLHLSLSDICNYVVIDNEWYIINICGSLEKSNSEWKSKVVGDFCDFRDMLKNYVLLLTPWPEKEYFFYTFDRNNVCPNRLVPILLDHVFVKSARDRLEMFSKIYHELMHNGHKRNLLNKAIRSGLFDQYTNGGWDKDNMSSVLLDIYNYSYYDVKKIWSLLKFCRHIYQHYPAHGANVNCIEKEVRELWPGFLEKLLHYY